MHGDTKSSPAFLAFILSLLLNKRLNCNTILAVLVSSAGYVGTVLLGMNSPIRTILVLAVMLIARACCSLIIQ